jgi:hypothetical protein
LSQKNQLEMAQLEAYLDVAREQGFDALLTISNEIPAVAGTHPTPVDRRKLKRVGLHHLPWTQVLTEAVIQKTYRGVSDPDQAWILGELIRYLEHPRSGALEFDDMGQSWVTVREAVGTGTLKGNDKAAGEVASRWDQLVRYACLRLGRQLGIEVQPVLSRREVSEPAVRAQALLASLASTGRLEGQLRIPNTVGPITVTADLRANKVEVSTELEAPREGRPLTRVNWLVRQLKDAPDTLRIDAFALHGRGAAASELLRDVRANPAVLAGDGKRELRSFRMTMIGSMGSKRGQGRGSFVSSVLDLLDTFYESVMQQLKAWSAPPPKLRPPQPEEPEPKLPTALVSTSLSSQDGPEPADPTPQPAAADDESESASSYTPSPFT